MPKNWTPQNATVKDGKIVLNSYPADLGRRIEPDRLALNNSLFTKGGIDFNSANLHLQIKRDGNGVPLPIAQQDLENIKIDGLIPIIIDIRPASSLPIFSQLQNTVQPANA